ncbi:hypothetical protein FIBSPDRAFT_162037 [Athelia psychrophila]|uniref:Uncharacterized protein n=1 Tax=Athelia psychrophila TaxID=1759441 RepID=A0A166SWI6_9AGAM|nr:hypothetical protein FIBSPDRAFT_162037 [Fibularhizoctonia sp. CBS 109695]
MLSNALVMTFASLQALSQLVTELSSPIKTSTLAMPLQCHHLPTILPSVSAKQEFLYASCNYDFRVAAKQRSPSMSTLNRIAPSEDLSSEPLSHKQPSTISSPARRRAR